jgi:molybdopterin synthase catalytic subunit
MFEEIKTNTTWVALTHNKLDLEGISAWCTVPSCGAVVNFVGTTRDNFEDKSVTYLTYEAYVEMALHECQAICEEAIQKFPGTLKASIHHRLGRVDICETSIICSISSAHRKEGFEACEWMMRDLKARVPIWKKEFFVDGYSQWKENTEQFTDI